MSQTRVRVAMVAAAVALLALIVFLVMPKERADQLSETFKRITGDPGVACMDYQRLFLKDPESARLVKSQTSGDAPLQEVLITYRAQNSYGAFGTSDANCVLDKKGGVDVAQTESKRKLKSYLLGLDNELACLNQKIEDRKNGDPLIDANYAACQLKAKLNQ